MADIPGIIEGASSGVGLGIEFLKHIERTKLLLFIIDLDDPDYELQFDKLRKEIFNYSQELYNKPYLIAASKYDLHDGAFKIELLESEMNIHAMPFSSVTHEGVDKLLYALKDKIHSLENESLK
jgi:GTP-binding protein